MLLKNTKSAAVYRDIFTSEFVGLKYFIEFFTDYRFGELVRNTLVISTLKLIFAFPVPILLAIMISEAGNNSFRRFIQTASYLPNFISWILVYGISTALFSESFGIVNQLLQSFGVIDKGIPFLTSPDLFWAGSSIVNRVRAGGRVFLAISGIDPNLRSCYDGAGRLERIWYTTESNMIIQF